MPRSYVFYHIPRIGRKGVDMFDAMLGCSRELLTAAGKNVGIEETFKDLKEVWGWGKQYL